MPYYPPPATGGGMSIGGAVASGTSKSVLFIDSSGNLAQNNANLAWDNTNDRLSIGASGVPTIGVEDVYSTSANALMSILHRGVQNGSYTPSFPTGLGFPYLGIGMNEYPLSGNGYYTIGFGFNYAPSGTLTDYYPVEFGYAMENATSDTYGSLIFATRPAGTGLPLERMRIQSDGNVGIGNAAPGALLDLGLAGTKLGVIRLAGSTSGNVSIKPAIAAGSWSMTLPTSGGTSGYFLQTDGNGVTTWAAGLTIGSSVGSGSSGSILYVDGSGNLAQDNSNFKYTASSKTIDINGPIRFGSSAYFIGNTSNGFVINNHADTLNLVQFYPSGGGAIGQDYANNGSDPGFNNFIVEGNIGIGIVSTTARLHLAAGATGAGKAPIKLTAGTNLTTPEVGAVEFDGTFLYLTTSSRERIVAVPANGRATAQTAAVSSVIAYTVGAADASFLVSANANITAFVAGTFNVQVTYTDETNTSRTLNLNFSSITGTLGIALAAAGPFEGIPAHIRAKAATAITILTTGTFTSLTYNVEGYITQIG